MIGRLAAALLAAMVAVTWWHPVAGQEPAASEWDPATFGFGIERIGQFERPVQVVDPGDGSGRLFVVEQGGLVRIVRNGDVLPDPFLDLRDRISTGNFEQGLLGIAFDPAFAENGLVYAGYTANTGEGAGDNSIARFKVSADNPDAVDPASMEVLLAIPDPFGNHNGGLVAFGPDGYLYAGFGDGGSSAGCCFSAFGSTSGSKRSSSGSAAAGFAGAGFTAAGAPGSSKRSSSPCSGVF